MKIKKILFTIFIVIATLLIFNVKSEATLELNELDFDAQINSDGSMNITEIWDINISETNTLFKTFKIDNSKYSNITEVEVTDISSNTNFSQINEEMYHVTKNCYYALINSNGAFEIAWGVGLDNSSARKTYQISYKVNDAIAKYNDYAELYWQFIGEDFEIDADKITGTIYLPYDASNKEDIRVWGHTQDLNGEIYVTDLNKIEFTINNYSSGNYVEVRSLIPNDMIYYSGRTYDSDILEKVLSEEGKWADEANARRNFRKGLIICATVVGIILIIASLVIFLKNIRKYFKMQKKYKPSTKLQYFRELPYEDATPPEALFIFSNGNTKNFSSSFSANILDLCLKKYITLEAERKEGIIKSDIIKITIVDKEISDLKDDEKLTLEFLKDVAKYTKSESQNTITTKDITKYLEKHLRKVEQLDEQLGKIIENEEIKRENYNKQNYEKMAKYMGKCILSLMLMFIVIPIIIYCVQMRLNIISIAVSIILMMILMLNAIMYQMTLSKINIFTQKGVDEREQWKAFKKYMEDFSLLKDKEVPALAIWEKYLVFATAFGISDKVLKQLKVIYPEMMDMNSAMYTYSYINIMNSVNIGNCINSSVYSAIGSSGSGAGGGFSGGGGGGRWPEAAVADAKM